MVGASASFAAMSACVKALSDTLPTSQIVFLRCLLPLPYLLLLVRRRGARMVAERRGLIAARCLLGAAAMSLYFYGLGRIPLGDASLLIKSQPLFVTLLAPILLGERAGIMVVVALVCSVAGAALILRPELAVGGTVGLLIVLGAGLSAGAHVAIRKLTEHEDPATVVLDFTAFVAVASLAVGAPGFVAPAALDLPAVLGVGLFATLGQLLMTHAYQADEAPGVAAAGYATVVFSMLLGWLIWSEIPTAGACLGGALLVGAGLLLLRSRTRVPSVLIPPVAEP